RRSLPRNAHRMTAAKGLTLRTGTCPRYDLSRTPPANNALDGGGGCLNLPVTGGTYGRVKRVCRSNSTRLSRSYTSLVSESRLRVPLVLQSASRSPGRDARLRVSIW